MLTQEQLQKSPLFSGISYDSYLAMHTCFQAESRSYRPGEMILDFTAPQDSVGIIEQGEAALLRLETRGTETVMERYTAGGVFGRSLAFPCPCGDPLQVVCLSAPCEVLFIDYSHILKRCERACLHHSLLVQNMLQLLADKAGALTERVDVLSCRSIREKLLRYFRQLQSRSDGDTILLPFSLSALADYIAADRSAMMRELKKMRDENLISTDGRRITLTARL